MTFLDRESLQYDTKTGIVVLNTDGVLVEVNAQYLAMSGFQKEEVIGQKNECFESISINEISSKNNVSFGHYHSTLIQKEGFALPVNICCFYHKTKMIEQYFLFITQNDSDDLAKTSIIEKIFDHTNEAIIVTDNQGIILAVNNSFSSITGYMEEEVLGKTPAILSSGKQDKQFYQKFWKTIKEQGSWQGEIWNKRKNGEIFPEWLNISSIRDKESVITNYICQFTDITNRKKSEEELHFQAYHDTLTSLPNRNLLFKRLNRLCDLNTEQPICFAVLFCDLDRFKMINDSLGHDVGDELLKSVSSRFDAKLRDGDFIARTGGDEFIVVIEGEKSLSNMGKICEQILSLFEKPFQTKYGEFKTSISIGVSQFPHDSMDVRELISFADVAMFKVKASGGNHFSFFDNNEKKLITQRLELENEIHQAIDKKQFEVWYQPQINTKTNEVYGIECLIRWNHPVQGLIAPDLFIPIAEVNGSIKELGYFVLKTACHQLRQWRIDNIFTGVMAINVSIRQFERNDLLGQVKKTLTDEMLPADAIELEVTESLFSEGKNYHIPILREMRELGVKVAIDDFGTGYSSLQRLKNLPINNVKIDKCFIDNIDSCAEDAAIVMAVILIASTFNIDLIAEGIETQEQADLLNHLGCYKQQGYLYSKPLPASNFEIWITDFKKKQYGNKNNNNKKLTHGKN